MQLFEFILFTMLPHKAANFSGYQIKNICSVERSNNKEVSNLVIAVAIRFLPLILMIIKVLSMQHFGCTTFTMLLHKAANFIGYQRGNVFSVEVRDKRCKIW